ncbi:NAD(P)/FAD-dependent oxidoreductase [Aspergillus ibericus CBS 121593]|uniref:FAD/NAD(P)-binding domain-containing protein n=1 Tax=Aspergillus ibericus CBS 121593 TaxID=1448316 RepID=A0A395GIN5_9EURO|nr:FAD/NAD(P)-binding domain-containing protein [Aspergillus ibericus CBS 121593]RAK94898.1 FAD/NAD(P)-binding domain-containing protein [Aspergillus ibericus CBS 121593]
MSTQLASVVIIGASHAGLGVTHKLLRQTTKASITLINPSDEYYFNIAAPRFLVKPESLPSSKYLFNIRDSFTEYPNDTITFIKGLATKIDYAKKSSHPEAPPPRPSGQGRLKLPFKTTAFENTRDAISAAQKTLQSATRIVIGGGGPLGVELTGELAEAPGPAKTITLISKTESLLPDAPTTVQRTAESLLQRKSIEVLKPVTVRHATQDPNTQTWTITLSTDQTITADAYISTTGTIPNNAYIPTTFLTPDGWVKVDEHLNVVDTETSLPDIYAVGDITYHPDRLLSRVSKQAITVAVNIVSRIENEYRPVRYSADAQMKMLVVSVGRGTGTGHLAGWTLWGCLVWVFKGRDYLTYEAGKFWRGRAK